MCADFNFYLNRQGVRGVQGVKGDDGFSPVITVAQDNAEGYKLHIQTATDDFDTSNLRPPITNAGGKYLLWDNATGAMTAGFLDYATTEVVGGVNLATSEDMEEGENTQVVPSVRVVADYVEGKLEENNTTISSTIAQTVYQNINVASGDTNIVITKNLDINSTDITDITVGLSSNLTNISRLEGKANENVIGVDVSMPVIFLISDGSGVPIIVSAELDTILNESQSVWFSLKDGGKVASGSGFKYAVGAPAVWVTYPNDDAKTHFLLDEGALVNGGGLSITNNNATSLFSLVGTTEQDTIRPTVTIGVNTDNDTIKINEQGQLYADIEVAGAPIATTSTAGIVKPDGTTIQVSDNGTISAVGGGTGDVTAAGNNTFTSINTFNNNTTFNNPVEFTDNVDFRGVTVAHEGITAKQIGSADGYMVFDNINDTPTELAFGDTTANTTIRSAGDIKAVINGSTETTIATGVDLQTVKDEVDTLSGNVTDLQTQVGNISTVLDQINGEVI